MYTIMKSASQLVRRVFFFCAVAQRLQPIFTVFENGGKTGPRSLTGAW